MRKRKYLVGIAVIVLCLPIAKDGADLAPAQHVATTASFTIALGETYDFTLTPEKSGKVEFTYNQSLLDEQ